MNNENNLYKEQFENLNKYTDREQYLEEFINLVKNIFYNRTFFVKNSNNDSKRDNFYKILKSEIEEIYKSQNNMTSNIEFINCGHTSLVFKIGECVLKISKTKNKQNNKNFDCVVPSYSFKCFKINEDEYYTLQISILVDTKNISDSEVYSAYKSLRDLGYIWNDPKPENVGRIIDDIQLNNKKYYKGDIVVTDLEDLAYVGEITTDEVLEEISMMSYNRKTYLYETRHMEEKNKAKILTYYK